MFPVFLHPEFLRVHCLWATTMASSLIIVELEWQATLFFFTQEMKNEQSWVPGKQKPTEQTLYSSTISFSSHKKLGCFFPPNPF